MTSVEPLLSIAALAVKFGDFQLSGVDLAVTEGSFHVLLGGSGTGKTVLLELIAGLVKPTAGRIRLDGRDLARVPIHRRGLGLVYQDQALFPHRSVAGNIGYALRGPGQAQRVVALAEAVGAAHLLTRQTTTLSGGEAQRVALARALATRPRLLLLDEPLSALDTCSRIALRALLRRLHADGQTILHVTHDAEEAIALADRVSILEDGRIIQTGSPQEVFHHPRSAFVASFAGMRTFIVGELLDGPVDDRPFRCACGILQVASDDAAGPGWLTLRSEDISLSDQPLAGSARNHLEATVVDLEPGRLGLSVTLAAGGEELVATITQASREALALAPGRRVQVSFKATAARFIPGGMQDT